MVHCEGVIRSEDPARNLNNEISELQSRVPFPRHWSSGEHEQQFEAPPTQLPETNHNRVRAEVVSAVIGACCVDDP